MGSYQADLDAYSQIYPLRCPQGNVEVRCPLWYPEDQEHTEDPYEYVIVKGAPDEDLNGLYLRNKHDHNGYQKCSWQVENSEWNILPSHLRRCEKRYKDPNVDENIWISKPLNGNWVIEKWENNDIMTYYESQDNVCLKGKWGCVSGPDGSANSWDINFCPTTGWQRSGLTASDGPAAPITVECYYPEQLDVWLETKRICQESLLGDDLGNLVFGFGFLPYPKAE